MQHTWNFFDAQAPPTERPSRANSASPYKRESPMPSNGSSALIRKSMGDATRLSADLEELRSVTNRRLSVPSPGGVFRRAGALHCDHTTQPNKSKLFEPGEYIYTFELAIGNDVPESINVQYGSVKWQLEAMVERTGWFRPNLSGMKEVTLVRVPGEDSVERTEPIVHRKFWENSLQYEIVISGKWFPLGSKIPIGITFTPLTTVRCLRVEIALTEEIERFTSDTNGRPSRLRRSIPLLGRDGDGAMSSAFPGSSVGTFIVGKPEDSKREKATPLVTISQQSGTLENPESQPGILSTTWDFVVQLAGCDTTKETERIHVDTISKYIQVRHWMKARPSSLQSCNVSF